MAGHRSGSAAHPNTSDERFELTAIDGVAFAQDVVGRSGGRRLRTTPTRQGRAMSHDQVSANELAAMRDAVDRALAAKNQSGKAGIAAAILHNGVVIGRGENEVHLRADPTKHAEMVALTVTAHAVGNSDLSGCVMISTLQPCEMCLAAMRFAGIERVIFGATQAKVAAKYFMFPGLSIADFQAAGKPFVAIGGLFEAELLPLYVDGQE